MTGKIQNDSAAKNGLHPRNPHRFRYDFAELIKSCPELGQYVKENQYGNESINFADPSAVKMLNTALLKHFYGITYWEIPEKYLCPPIPGRADYIHYIADLLASCNCNMIPAGESISVLDIGTGANCVYPLIGHHEYGWNFTGTDIDPVSINSAQKIIDLNNLAGHIDLRIQKSHSEIFRGIIKPEDRFDITICNPPFHASAEDAEAGTLRKLSNLNSKKITGPILNFGGQNRELWTPGGEEFFIDNMIKESSQFSNNCFWFTTLVSKKTTLPGVYKALKKVKAAEVRTIEMAQGQKISRIAAWTFLNKEQQNGWRDSRWR
jgi:23S rRNA (adenine1618-N6)-methyltransferase